MNWYDNAIIYHIYPLGFCGAPKFNDFSSDVSYRLDKVVDWIPHLKEMNVDAVYFGPVFESVEHGYDTVDYRVIDRRLGTNADFKEVCDKLHENGIEKVHRDTFHSTFGLARYSLALLWYKALTGRDISNIDFGSDLKLYFGYYNTNVRFTESQLGESGVKKHVIPMSLGIYNYKNGAIRDLAVSPEDKVLFLKAGDELKLNSFGVPDI